MRKYMLGLLAATAVAVGAQGVPALRPKISRSPWPARSPGSTRSSANRCAAAPQMAIEDINAKGGVMGRKLKLEIGDDACDPRQAVAVANQLASKKVSLRRRAFLLVFLDPGEPGL